MFGSVTPLDQAGIFRFCRAVAVPRRVEQAIAIDDLDLPAALPHEPSFSSVPRAAVTPGRSTSEHVRHEFLGDRPRDRRRSGRGTSVATGRGDGGVASDVHERRLCRLDELCLDEANAGPYAGPTLLHLGPQHRHIDAQHVTGHLHEVGCGTAVVVQQIGAAPTNPSRPISPSRPVRWVDRW